MRTRIRSRFLAWVVPVFLSVLPGCTEMVREELDETHAKLRALQELAGAVNRDLTTLDLIVQELDDGHTILPESFRETETGYEVTFRDDKKIFIPFGQDGVSFIPVGVQDDADGLFYWKVNGEWLLDADGNKIRAGAIDGIVPQFQVREDGYWWISVDGGRTFTPFAPCSDMDGIGVFRDAVQTARGKVILTLWDGQVIELASEFPFRMAFAGPVRDTLLIAAGERLPIPYEVIVDGETDQPVVVTSGTDGTYLSSVQAGDGTSGVVTVQAPADFAEGYIFLTASCGGYSAVKMMAFKQRTFTPDTAFSTLRFDSGEGSQTVPFEANFDYTVSGAESWLEVVSDPETGTLTFTVQPNTGENPVPVRSCEVTLTPKDNPDFACTTYKVIQATDSYTVALEEGGAFTFDEGTLLVPAAGGEATLWLTFRSALSVSVPETAAWLQAGMAATDGFYRLTIQVAPAEEPAGREETLLIQVGAVPIGEIKVIQAGAPAGE